MFPRLKGILDSRGRSWGRGRSRRLLREVSTLGNAAVLREVEVQGVVVPLPGQQQEDNSAAGNHENVQNTKKDEVRRDANGVAALGDTKRDRVQKPEEVEVPGEDPVVSLGTHALRPDAALGKSRRRHDEVSDGAEDEEAPLVDGRGVGRDEVADDPDPGEEDVPDDGGPGRVGDEAQEDVDDGEGHDPVDILVEEDLPRSTRARGRALDHDGPAEVGGVGEVCDGAD